MIRLVRVRLVFEVLGISGEQDSELLRGIHVGKVVHIRPKNSSLQFNAVVISIFSLNNKTQ